MAAKNPRLFNRLGSRKSPKIPKKTMGNLTNRAMEKKTAAVETEAKKKKAMNKSGIIRKNNGDLGKDQAF